MDSKSPTRWAADIRQMMKAAFGDSSLPVDVAYVAQELSQHWDSNDPISAVVGADLPNFDGALIRDPDGQKGWLILYNERMDSSGRIRFTIAHEFGHYLQHRAISPKGFHCRGEDFVRWDATYQRVENEANIFASNLLMPLDDFRSTVSEHDPIDFETLSYCADRYGVSMIAAALRWLEYTARRAVLVLSREGFILWARSSEPAFKSGLFIKSAGRPPSDVPEASLAMQPVMSNADRCVARHASGVWFAEECDEFLLSSERYDFSISLLLFSNTRPDWDTQQANRKRGLGGGR